MESAAAGGPTITIDRIFFENLLKRAHPPNGRASSAICDLSPAEHKLLERTALRYANLRYNLRLGGISDETIDLLSQDKTSTHQHTVLDATGTSSTSYHESGLTSKILDPQAPSWRFGPLGTAQTAIIERATDHATSARYGGRIWDEDDDITIEEEVEVPLAEEDFHVTDNRLAVHDHEVHAGPQFEKVCTRSVYLAGLPNGVEHSDITEAVRGGQLLDIFIRHQERAASVAFLHAADARAFLDHARRHDLYIKNKRVDVRYAERHFVLGGHVAHKLSQGASRNLIIRRCDPRITEEEIRDDLEHISNLVVIKVDIMGGSCYIRTNSVHNAMFARTCMMSRAKYKGSKIDWDVDECAQPYPPMVRPKSRKETSAPKAKSRPIANRFDLLSVDMDDGVDELGGLPAMADMVAA